MDIGKTNRTLKKWMKSKYYKIKKENQYANVKNKIINAGAIIPIIIKLFFFINNLKVFIIILSKSTT